MNIEKRRDLEVDKYIAIYDSNVNYTINARRLLQSACALEDFIATYPLTQSMLDVGCGDGAWMRHAADIFSLDCFGIDPVPSLAGEWVLTYPATNIPYKDKSFDLVTCLDVMEHLIEEDTILALSEIARVAKYGAIITVNNNPSHYRGVNDVELHVNIKPYEEWGKLLKAVFGSVKMVDDSGANRVFIV